MTEGNGFPQVPGWETVRKLGSGSYGTVYEIRRELFGHEERAALKHIRLPRSDSEVEELYGSGYDEAGVAAQIEEQLADIVREYSLMAEMKGHTNILYCDDIRYEPQKDGVGWDIYIRMELLTPLLKALNGEMAESEVIRLGKDLCRALSLCRSRNIVHRDIKPQNILVSADGNYKLGDFGIARTMERTSGATRIGSFNYMAPEVYGSRPYGHTADLYSLGLVLYWLLNERRGPFLPLPPKVPTVTEQDRCRERRMRGEPLPPPAHGSEALKRVVLRACAFDPRERYQTAEELLAALEAAERSTAFELKKPVRECVCGTQPLTEKEGDYGIPWREQVNSEETGFSQPLEEEKTVGAYGMPWREQVNSEETGLSQPLEEEKTVGAYGMSWREQVNQHETKPSPFSQKDGPEMQNIRLKTASMNSPAPLKGGSDSSLDGLSTWTKESAQTTSEKETVLQKRELAFHFARLDKEEEARSTASARKDSRKRRNRRSTDAASGVWAQGSGTASVEKPKAIWNADTAVLLISDAEVIDHPEVTIPSWNAIRQSVRSIRFGERVRAIEAYAFFGCTCLTSVTIPTNVRSIGESALAGCGRLRDIYYEGTELQWKLIHKGIHWCSGVSIHFNS